MQRERDTSPSQFLTQWRMPKKNLESIWSFCLGCKPKQENPPSCIRAELCMLLNNSRTVPVKGRRHEKEVTVFQG